jgi:argininosuccinate synthase
VFLLQHTPIGRAVTGTMLVVAMKEGRREYLGRRAARSRERHRAVLSLRVARNPNLKIYKPWLDQQFIDELGGRKEMSEYMTRAGLAYKMSAEKAYSTDSNLLGATHEAKDLEYLQRASRSSSRSWASLLERERRDQAERSVIALRKGSRSPQRHDVHDPVKLMLEANAHRRTARLGMSDQIENRIIEAKSRGIYEAPAWRFSSLLRASGHRDPQRGHHRAVPRQRPQTGTPALSGAVVRFAGDDASRRGAALGRAAVTGEVTVELRRGNDYSILDTTSPNLTYKPERLTMEKGGVLHAAGSHRAVDDEESGYHRHARQAVHVREGWRARAVRSAKNSRIRLIPDPERRSRREEVKLTPFSPASATAARANRSRRGSSSARKQHGKFDVQFADLKELNLPHLDEPHHPRLKKYVHDSRNDGARLSRLGRVRLRHAGIQLHTPPALVNALDTVYHEWTYKPVGFVTYGGMFRRHARDADDAEAMVTGFKMMPMVEAVNIPFFTQLIENGVFKSNETHDKAVPVMLDELLRWAEAMKVLRAG